MLSSAKSFCGSGEEALRCSNFLALPEGDSFFLFLHTSYSEESQKMLWATISTERCLG
jgi:hypothetical protein